jgi:adenylate cyclase
MVILDTLHLIYEGRAYRWRADMPEAVEAVDYGRTHKGEGEAAENWQRSPFFYLLLDQGAVTALQRLAPFLKLAMKSAALARMAGTLAETYLGRDAGRRVMSGRIMRGVAEKIGAVLWYSDLHGYTHITDSAPPEQIIPLLNDYAEVVVSGVHGHGGDVLKLIGDGTLAIFAGEDREAACVAALTAATQIRQALAKTQS